jgi:hypothetical protein
MYMGEKLGIIVWRDASKAIYRRYINDKGIDKIVEGSDRDKGYSSQEADETFQIQTGHRSRVGGGDLQAADQRVVIQHGGTAGRVPAGEPGVACVFNI